MKYFGACTMFAFPCQVQICDEKGHFLTSHSEQFYFNLATFGTEQFGYIWD